MKRFIHFGAAELTDSFFFVCLPAGKRVSVLRRQSCLSGMEGRPGQQANRHPPSKGETSLSLPLSLFYFVTCPVFK